MSDDLLHRFIFDNTDIRGEIVTIEQALYDIFSSQAYPPPLQQLLGEFLAAASLLSRTLKFDGIMTLQARGDGDLPVIMAEVNHQKKVRGVAEYNKTMTAEQWQGRSLQSLLGQGVLSIIIDPDKGQRYQGIVPLEQPDLASCLETYFLQSEQLPTRLWLVSNGRKASGMLLQRLPQQLATTTINDDAWETQSHLASTVTGEELLSIDHETLLTRLFHETGVRMFPPETVSFGCSCSKARCSQTLRQIGQQELHHIIAEKGRISVDCHFCGFQYHYSESEINDLFAPETRH